MGRHIAGRDKATAAAGRSKLLEVPLREVDHQASLPRQPYLPPGTGVPQLHTQRPPSTTTSGHSHLPLYFLLLLLFLDRVQIDPHDLFRPKAPGGERRKGREGKPKAGVAGHKNERKKGLKQEAAAATVEAAKQRSRSLCPSCRRLLLGPWRCFVPLPLSPSSYTNISFTRNQTEPLPIASLAARRRKRGKRREMEHGEGSSGKRPPAAGLTVKRLMKSPSQVQILEEAYAVESNPSTMMKADLARRTGLEYTQVQYWFGNRRFLDKHGPRTNTPRIDRHGLLWEFNPDRTSSMSPVTVARAGPAPNGSVYSVETLPTMRAAGQSTVNPGLVPVLPCVPLTTQSQLLPVSQELQWMITHVENNLGHPLRADGPILGTEFDALPAGAFGFRLGIIILTILFEKNESPLY
ncbi:hypothetical protein GW17_00008494 [Ensete ventricosum]|nr:hypothetical protein GW17_00008494 [Ensete ventricosum]